MSDKLIWEEKTTDRAKLRRAYNFIEWLMYEMEEGRVKAINSPLSIAFVKMAEKGEIDEVTASEHAEMFLSWNEKGTYNVGDLRTHATETETRLYKCLQAHTAQANWTPDVSPALWKAIGINENGIPEYSKPVSVDDTYMTGDEMMFKGVHYRSKIDYNVWTPEEYPDSWEIVE